MALAGGGDCGSAPGGLLGWWGCTLTGASEHLMTALLRLGAVAPLLVAVTAAISVAVWVLRAFATMGAAQGAVWLEITPPKTLPAGAGLALWRVLAGVLGRARGTWLWGRPALSVEWFADPGGVRAGVWLPAGIRPGPVADALERACPGARVRPTHPPVWWRYPSRCVELAPAAGPWTPLIDPATARRAAGQVGGSEAAEEPLRALLGALAGLRPGEQAAVQLVVSHHRTGGAGGGVAGLLRGATPALLGGVTGAVAAGVLAVLDLFSSSSRPTRRRARGQRTGGASAGDPVRAAAAKAADAKRAAGPHLRVTLRVAATVPMPTGWRAERARAGDLTAGFDLVTDTELRPVWRRLAVAELLVLHGHGRRPFHATLPELAALWHLPTTPGRFGLTAATTRFHDPGRGVSTGPDTSPTTGAGDTDARPRRQAPPPRPNGQQGGEQGGEPGHHGRPPAGLARPVPTRPPNRPAHHGHPSDPGRPARVRDPRRGWS
ncbi:hypothetical protein BKA01_008048 [Pseudonocardia eucalypti]|uniref:hypothetical protein n=1 Tax=Pseudonocardia eucalypti TaxID=648755 RepID=UPI00161456C6|nr:hypothetical protein [Pseudonocardia eucalypti]MBB6380771.1 hypothetical protein [Pseudonocardia eucalypti]